MVADFYLNGGGFGFDAAPQKQPAGLMGGVDA
jgi:hypothetical protein